VFGFAIAVMNGQQQKHFKFNETYLTLYSKGVIAGYSGLLPGTKAKELSVDL